MSQPRLKITTQAESLMFIPYTFVELNVYFFRPHYGPRVDLAE